MRIKEINLYRFSELSETAQEKAIEKWYEKEDYPFLCEDITNYISEVIDTRNVFSDIELRYSLSYSQSDGLSFSANFDLKKWLDQYDFQQFKKNAIEQQFIVNVKANNGHYTYCSKSNVSYEYNCSMNYFQSDLSNLESLFESVLSDIQTYYVDICKQAEKYGYSEIEYRMPVDEFLDFCESNDYEFLIDGTLC